jgi:predicted transcriptional regulator
MVLTDSLITTECRMDQTDTLTLAADIVSAYVGNNHVQASELPNLIATVHAALNNVGKEQSSSEPAKREPAVNPKKSVTPDHIISLFDGKKFKSLRRYLRTSHNMTPEQYREYWGLPRDYPMVAPNYAKARSEMAKQIGLGSMRKGQSRGEEKPARGAAKSGPKPARKSAKAA